MSLREGGRENRDSQSRAPALGVRLRFGVLRFLNLIWNLFLLCFRASHESDLILERSKMIQEVLVWFLSEREWI